MPRIRTKLLIAFLVIVLVPLIGTGLYGNWTTSQIITKNAIESARNDVQLHAEQVVDSLQRVHGDVLYLAHLDSLDRFIQAQNVDDKSVITAEYTRVMRDFLIFSAARPAYYQIRYIDEFGQEVVRIDSDGRTSRVVRESDLQNKAHRYYFQEAMQLPSGGIFVSPLDLNRENNQIERPFTPVIRYATPLFDDLDNRRGIVIVNIYAAHFMASLQEDSSADSQLIMVDQDGYYLIHPDTSRLWGGPTDLNNGKNIWQDYPEQAAMLLQGGSGDFKTQDRAVVYTTLFPVAADRTRYWVIMRDSSATTLFAPIRSFRLTAVSILAAAILVAMGMALILSRQLANPILTLRQGVERFGQGKLDQPIPVHSQDEIGQLTRAFNDMASTINRHLDQLSVLNKAGQKISSGLEKEATLDAISQATRELFSADYCAILLKQADDSLVPLTEVGDTAWALQRETKAVQATHQHVLAEGAWQSAWLDDLQGYYCCACLSWEPNQLGVIELYGRHPTLLEPTTGNLLFTLAVEASVALENIDLYEKLADHKQQLEALVKQLINAQEAERKFVAYDIHDGLIQYLVGARLHLSKLFTQQQIFSPRAQAVLDETMTHLTRAVQEGRRVIEGLRPTLLDDMGLAPALNELARDVGNIAGWQVRFANELGDERLSSATELTAFRVAQEALTNVRKHADATQVELLLARQNGYLFVSVTDNGTGFDQSAIQKSRQCFGLVSMRERTALLGGDCHISSMDGTGTTVSVRLPI